MISSLITVIFFLVYDSQQISNEPNTCRVTKPESYAKAMLILSIVYESLVFVIIMFIIIELVRMNLLIQVLKLPNQN